MKKTWYPERFKECRAAAKLTQNQIADVCINKSGDVLTRSAVSQWEMGDTTPEIGNAKAAIELMRKRGSKCTLDYLTGLSDDVGMDKEEFKILSLWRSLAPAAKDQISGLMESLSQTPEYVYQQTNHEDQARFNMVAEKSQSKYRIAIEAAEKAENGIKLVEKTIGTKLDEEDRDEILEILRQQYIGELSAGNKLPENEEAFDNVISLLKAKG